MKLGSSRQVANTMRENSPKHYFQLTVQSHKHRTLLCLTTVTAQLPHLLPYKTSVFSEPLSMC